MEDRNMQITFESKLDQFVSYGQSFDGGVLRIAYHGYNRNGSYISKQDFERCAPTMFNRPVVANYMRQEDEIGGHDAEIVSKNGSPKLINITQPVGIVPQSADYWWENVTEEDGADHEYLCTEVLLWKRQEAYEKIRSDGIVAESMEISINSSHMDDGTLMIDDFEFLAFCLLGNCEPCFESASLAMFSEGQFKSDIEQMMAEVQTAEEFRLERRTNALVNEKLTLMKEFGLELEDLDFELDDFTVDELRVKFTEYAQARTPGAAEDGDGDDDDDPDDNGEPDDGGGDDPDPDDGGDPDPDDGGGDGGDDGDGGNDGDGDGGGGNPDDDNFSLTANQFRDEMEKSVMDVERDEDGWPRFWMIDYDTEENMVICQDDMFHGTLVGMKYADMNDSITIDPQSAKRVKVKYVDFYEDNTIPSAPNTSVIYSVHKEIMEKKSAEYEAELKSLREFKADVEKERRESAVADVFEAFNKELSGNAEFEALKENNAELSVEQIEEKCFAIKGKAVMNFSHQPTSRNVTLPIDDSYKDADEPYGGIVSKYIK